MNTVHEVLNIYSVPKIVHPDLRCDSWGEKEKKKKRCGSLLPLDVGRNQAAIPGNLCFPESLFFLLPPLQSSSTLSFLAFFLWFQHVLLPVYLSFHLSFHRIHRVPQRGGQNPRDSAN